MLNALQKFSGMHVYCALRIPDTYLGERTEVDLVILTKRKLFVVEVKNWCGRVELDADGSWCQLLKDGSVVKHPNAVEDTQERAALLESYISRRGLTLPPSSLQCKVVLVNPNCRAEEAILSKREVLSFDEWESFLAKETKKSTFEWLQLVRPKRKKVLASDLRQQLHAILSTAPTWDRLMLEGGCTVLGEFLHFKGSAKDMEALKTVKRSRVSHLTMAHQRLRTNDFLGLFGGAFAEVEVTCTVRDYRTNSMKRKHKDCLDSKISATIRPDMEVVFRAVGTTRAQHFKVSNVVAIQLTP